MIVDSDDRTAEYLEGTLVVHGFETCRVGTGAAALERFAGAGLVLVALDLPDLAGSEVCRLIRERSCVPIIALSGSAEEVDRVMALHMGADDFMMKPFGRYELVARVKALFRRSAGCTRGCTDLGSSENRSLSPSETLEHGAVEHGERSGAGTVREAGPLRLDPHARKVYLRGKELHVTRKEFDLLAMLLEGPGTVRKRQEIMCRVWDENWIGSSRTLDFHVGSLRSKLGCAGWIETVRGVGFRLAVPELPVA
nr:response regulator transcription factor [Streptomyces taklimakanensis]